MSPTITATFIPISMLLGLTTFGLAARWYYLPWARSRSLKEAATPILLLHVLRYIGLGFLVTGLVSPLLNQTFARTAAEGDLVAAVLALVALFFLRRDSRYAKAWLWLFSVQGFLDLVTAVSLGVAYITPETLAGMYSTPAIGVPLMLVSHVALMVVLLRPATAGVHSRALPQGT